MTTPPNGALTAREAALVRAVRDEMDARLAVVANRKGLSPREVHFVKAIRDELDARLASLPSSQGSGKEAPQVVNEVPVPSVTVATDVHTLAAALDKTVRHTAALQKQLTANSQASTERLLEGLTTVLTAQQEATERQNALLADLLRTLAERPAIEVSPVLNLPELKPDIHVHVPKTKPKVVVFEHDRDGVPTQATIEEAPPPSQE